MNIDLGSFAFGSSLTDGVGTPSWGTALGQGRPEYYITRDGANDLVMGMVYKSVPLSDVRLPLGKGGRMFSCIEAGTIQIASLFDKVYVNGLRINHPFIMVLQKEDSASHSGRRSVKYTDKAEYQSGGRYCSNTQFVNAVYQAFGLSENACWFVYDISVLNHEELHMKAVIVNRDDNEVYDNSRGRSEEWIKLIEESGNSYNITNDKGATIKKGEYATLQQIFYGAPGTGKSHKVKEVTETLLKSDVFRTTFHPDSDYSTFVGCYKPTMVNKEPLISKGELINKLSNIKTSGVTYPCHKFAAQYWESLKIVSADDVKYILTSCGFTEAMNVEVSKGIAIGQELANKSDRKIIYSYEPQAFLKAYIQAYKTSEPVFLVIEEINRGNCAQIFGDMFQLLDRNMNGESDYAIKPETAIQEFLNEKLKDCNIADETIKSGEEMRLPANLHIWATMNTSDQSLFPIDSAFKRRWDWQYMPINYSNKDWKINLTGNTSVEWVKLQQKLNELIYDATESEDKMLGDWFVKADTNNVISEEVLVGKIIFYLWNDVARVDAGKLFDFELERHGRKCKVTFSDFYNNDGTINSDVVKKWLKQIEVLKEEPAEDRQDTPDNETSSTANSHINQE